MRRLLCLLVLLGAAWGQVPFDADVYRQDSIFSFAPVYLAGVRANSPDTVIVNGERVRGHYTGGGSTYRYGSMRLTRGDDGIHTNVRTWWADDNGPGGKWAEMPFILRQNDAEALAKWLRQAIAMMP